MALRDHIWHPETLPLHEQVALKQYHRWTAVQVTAATYGETVAARLWFLCWLYDNGQFDED